MRVKQMTTKEKEAIDALVLNAQKVFGCISRQGDHGFLAEEALEALEKARNAGLTEPLTIATSQGVQDIK